MCDQGGYWGIDMLIADKVGRLTVCDLVGVEIPTLSEEACEALNVSGLIRRGASDNRTHEHQHGGPDTGYGRSNDKPNGWDYFLVTRVGVGRRVFKLVIHASHSTLRGKLGLDMVQTKGLLLRVGVSACNPNRKI